MAAPPPDSPEYIADHVIGNAVPHERVRKDLAMKQALHQLQTTSSEIAQRSLEILSETPVSEFANKQWDEIVFQGRTDTSSDLAYALPDWVGTKVLGKLTPKRWPIHPQRPRLSRYDRIELSVLNHLLKPEDYRLVIDDRLADHIKTQAERLRLMSGSMEPEWFENAAITVLGTAITSGVCNEVDNGSNQISAVSMSGRNPETELITASVRAVAARLGLIEMLYKKN